MTASIPLNSPTAKTADPGFGPLFSILLGSPSDSSDQNLPGPLDADLPKGSMQIHGRNSRLRGVTIEGVPST